MKKEALRVNAKVFVLCQVRMQALLWPSITSAAVNN